MMVPLRLKTSVLGCRSGCGGSGSSLREGGCVTNCMGDWVLR